MSTNFNGNFLHNLPKALEAKQRIALEAISFSLDAIDIKYNTIINRLSMYRTVEKVQKMPRLERIAIFSDIWSMIDNAHAIMQLFYGAEKKTKRDEAKKLDFTIEGHDSSTGKITKTYYDEYAEPLRVLRNKMDHLSGNLEKIADKKAIQEPMFGTLAYILSNEKTPENSELDVVILTNSSFVREKHSFMTINPADLRRKNILIPVDHLQITAFDSDRINLTNLYEDSLSVREALNTDLASAFAQALRDSAKKRGIKEQDVFETLPGVFTGIMHIKMASAEEVQEMLKQNSEK